MSHTKTTDIISWDSIRYNTKGIILAFNKDNNPMGYIKFGDYEWEYHKRLCDDILPKFYSHTIKGLVAKLPISYKFYFINF